MNRELQQVRRYWPRAKQSGQLRVDGAVLWTIYVAYGSRRLQIVVYADGTASVGGWLLPIQSQPTIAEAMRAAGFGVRPLGEFSGRPNAVQHAWSADNGRGGWCVFLASCALQSTQRPRKGARLGLRKRDVQP